MSEKTQINQEKVRAYLATDYRLGHTDNDIILTIGRRSERLAVLFASGGVGCGAFITAYNPRGTTQSDEPTTWPTPNWRVKSKGSDSRPSRALAVKREPTGLPSKATSPLAWPWSPPRPSALTSTKTPSSGWLLTVCLNLSCCADILFCMTVEATGTHH